MNFTNLCHLSPFRYDIHGNCVSSCASFYGVSRRLITRYGNKFYLMDTNNTKGKTDILILNVVRDKDIKRYQIYVTSPRLVES